MTTATTDAALLELLSRLDLEAKVRLIRGDNFWQTAALPEIGLRQMTLSDGPVGVRGERFAEDDHSAAFPSASALAATWDDDLLEEVGVALAGEAARKGVDVVLGPTINLHRSPLAGRNFECYSEDPYLSGRLATAFVRGLQTNGVAACPKHFVANDAETDRTTVDNRIDERTLRELYLLPFDMVVRDADPWVVMSSYNGVNGAPMSENPLLADVLKGEWGWGGAVVSDWGGVYSTVPSARGGNDLAMPGPYPSWGDPLIEAIKDGEVDEAAIDEKVLRLLRLAARVGALDGIEPTVPKTSATKAGDAADLARATAVAGTVLLRNEGILPLQPASLRSVALIGPNALEHRHQGGGSSMVFAPYVEQPLPALQRVLGPDVDIATAVGAARTERLRFPQSHEIHDTVFRWLDDDGDIVAEHPSTTTIAIRSARSIPAGATSIEIVTRFEPTADGTWCIGAHGIGHFQLDIEGDPALDETHAPPADPQESVLAFPQSSVEVSATRGVTMELKLRHRLQGSPLIVSFGIVIQDPRVGSPHDEIANAVALARSADVAIVIVGTSDLEESEGRDRSDLRLRGQQDDLVAAVAAANPRTIVVVNAGAPVEMPWRDDVAALLLNWFPGMEGGNALADVLVGDAEPGGRLPTTWPASADTAPVLTTTPSEGALIYDEGLLIGYRAYVGRGIEPAYWFGYGLGYTDWSYEAVQATSETVTVRVRNTGGRRGRTVVQAYTSRPASGLERPAIVLSGYAVVEADAGETVDLDVTLDPRTLRHWNSEAGNWQIEPGPLTIHVGPHAGDLPLQAEVSITEQTG